MTQPLAVLAAVLSLAVAPLRGQKPEEFRARRAAVCEKLGEGQIFVLRGKDAVTGCPFRQDSDFYYLTGMTQPGGALILSPDGKELLFANRGRFRSSAWNSPTPGMREAKLVSGAGDVHAMTDFDNELAKVKGKSERISERRARQIVHGMRRVKSPAEIAKLETAIEITCAAQREAMRAARPGMFEYQLQAIVEHVFRFNGADKNGFDSILGSGPNATILHWTKNSRTILDGDVVVMDIGGEYGMYTADVTRTIPINGKFSKRQREIYEIVLRANEAGIAMVKPGVRMGAISQHVDQVLMDGLIELGMLKRRNKLALMKYYYHGLGHSLGLAVHDVGGLGTLEPGMVLTIEPGLYIKDEKMGFRIEDDVLVTKDGHLVLSASAPKSVAAIEAMMAEPGLPVERYTVKPVEPPSRKAP